MSRHVEDAHPDLVDAARAVVGELAEFAPRLDRCDGVDHEQHRVYLGRADRLAGHLRTALNVADQGEPASALVLVRSSLEHHVQDLILHRGTRYLRRQRIQDEAAWSEIQSTYKEQRERWARSLAEPPTRSKAGVVTFVFRGLADADADPATATDLLHPIYFEMDRYEPTLGRPADQKHFDDGITDQERRERQAKQNRERWRSWISWPAQRESLELNEIFLGRDLVAIDVHYAFLSGFTHTTNAAYDDAQGNWGSSSNRGLSELARELVYLYVAWLGSAELQLLAEMEERRPPVRIDGRAEVEDLIDHASQACAHLWPPGGAPHEHDRVQAMNRSAFGSRRNADGPTEVRPVSDEEIQYDANPLRRLRRMHTTFTELTTGISYQSPWPDPTTGLP